MSFLGSKAKQERLKIEQKGQENDLFRDHPQVRGSQRHDPQLSWDQREESEKENKKTIKIHITAHNLHNLQTVKNGEKCQT